MPQVTIERKLEVIGNNKIVVPGCEPTSAVTSVTLMSYQRRLGLCKNAIVDVQAVLDAIPGSRLEFGSNFNSPRKRWLVLPPFDMEQCPCVGETDWYGVIRRLASEDLTVEEKFDYCNTIGQGYCPSPDFKNEPPPPVPSYFEEGQNILFEHYTP